MYLKFIRGIFKNKYSETAVFVFLLLANTIPIFSGEYFITLDGPAHLYNAYIIKSLAFNESNIIDQFFMLNEIIVPNWSSHFLLSIFLIWLPSFMAEKLLLFIYLIAFPLAFRGIIMYNSTANRLLSYFAFPLAYSFPFLMGFYNFSIALTLCLITLLYWVRNEEKSFKIWDYILLSLLLTSTFFSHILIFAILIFLLTVRILNEGIKQHYIGNGNSVVFKDGFNKLKFLSISSILPLYLTYRYYSTAVQYSSLKYLSFDELLLGIKNLNPIVTFSIEQEAHAGTIFFVLAGLFIYIVVTRIYASKMKLNFDFRKLISSSFKEPNYWFIMAVIFILLYFTLPNQIGAGGFISIRIGLIFFIFLIFWFSTKYFPKWILVISIVITMYINLKLNQFYIENNLALNQFTADIKSVAEQVPENSIILPITGNDYWILSHLSNYLGTDKPMLILNNYECVTQYFPVVWNESKIPKLIVENSSTKFLDCTYWKSNENGKTKKIEYLIQIGGNYYFTENCVNIIDSSIQINYELVSNNKNCSLYKLK